LDFLKIYFSAYDTNEAPRRKQTGYIHLVFIKTASRGEVFTIAPAFSGIACLPATGW